MGEQKTQAKFLGMWLQALGLRLKLRHLDKLCAKFQRQVVRRRYMHEWLLACQKKLKVDEIAKVQDHQLLAKCWSTLIRHVDAQQKKKLVQTAASQEYTYWLGKRLIKMMRRNVTIGKAVKSLTK